MIQLNDLSCLKAGLHYLFVRKVDPGKITNHWHILKKHVDLTRYSAAGVQALNRSMGTVLAFVDGGYFLNISCVPANPNHPHPMFKSELMVKSHAVGMINAVFRNLCDLLTGLPAHKLESVMKNNLSDPGRTFLLTTSDSFSICSQVQ